MVNSKHFFNSGPTERFLTKTTTTKKTKKNSSMNFKIRDKKYIAFLKQYISD